MHSYKSNNQISISSILSEDSSKTDDSFTKKLAILSIGLKVDNNKLKNKEVNEFVDYHKVNACTNTDYPSPNSNIINENTKAHKSYNLIKIHTPHYQKKILNKQN